jgi:dipeptidyl aminopeptidase/acylaminoacyl peptidase
MKHVMQISLVVIAIVLFIAPLQVTWAQPPLELDSVTNLSGPMVAGGEVNSFDISPDGNYVIFRADKDLVGMMELYSVNLQTLAIEKLSNEISDGYDVSNVAISPDSQWVVYEVNNSSTGGSRLKSVPIGGGALPNNITNPVMNSSRHVRDFKITPDSAYVIFTCDITTEYTYDLYRSPITGVYIALPPDTPMLPEKLNDGLPTNYFVSSFDISPDGTFIIYRDQSGGYGRSIWRVPVSGGTNTKISTDVASFYMMDFLITPNNQRVLYRMTDGAITSHRLYSVLAAGGTATRLDNPTLSEGFIDQYRLSNNSSYVVFTGKLDDANMLEIYSAPVAGPAINMKKLNGSMISGGNIDCGLSNDYYDFAISPDSANVVYCADYFVDGRYEIFKTLTSGSGVVTRLSQAPSIGNGTYFFTISPDSERVLYNGHYNDAIYYEAFSIPMSGGTPTPLADFALSKQRSVFWMTIAPDSSQVVLEIGTSVAGTEGFRLYQSTITGGPVQNLIGTPTNTGHVYFRNTEFTPDSNYLVVISDMGTDGIDELFLVDATPQLNYLPVMIKP